MWNLMLFLHPVVLLQNIDFQGHAFIVVVNGERIVWVQFTQAAGSRTNALDDMPDARISLFINNSMLCMFTSSLGRLINFLLHWWILQCHDGSQFFYRAISCNAEYYQLYWNGRELTLFNYRMIKCLCISYTYISINSLMWIFISPCLLLWLSVCNIKDV